MMNPPTMMYNQPVMRPPNPFGPVSSAQVGARQSDSSTQYLHVQLSRCIHCAVMWTIVCELCCQCKYCEDDDDDDDSFNNEPFTLLS